MHLQMVFFIVCLPSLCFIKICDWVISPPVLSSPFWNWYNASRDIGSFSVPLRQRSPPAGDDEEIHNNVRAHTHKSVFICYFLISQNVSRLHTLSLHPGRHVTPSSLHFHDVSDVCLKPPCRRRLWLKALCFWRESWSCLNVHSL